MSVWAERALDLFGKTGFNCAQSVVAVFAEKYGLDEKTALKLASGFGGGVRTGDVCGAVSGGVMAIGLAYGQSEKSDMKAKIDCYDRASDFIKQFRAANGSHICRDLLGCDVGTPEGKAYFNEHDLMKTVCTKMVASAVEILEKLGY